MTATTTLPATVIKDRDEDTATPAGDDVVAAAAEAVGDVVRELKRHPAMLAVALGTVAIGVVARRPKLVGGGGRMLAAQLVAAVGATARTRLLSSGDGKGTPAHPLADMAAGVAIDWAVRAVREGRHPGRKR